MSKKLTFDDICKYLSDNEFHRVSVDGACRQIYLNDDKTLCVTVEERLIEKLSSEEEARIKKRLTDLGYL